jgi:flagellin
MPVVNTNVSASVTQSALAKNERALESAMEKLSTGRKINSASDDAAGLAMAAKFSSQIQGLDMAVKNANDAVSMLSTAEGALDEVTNMLQRMRELAVQSSNGTVTAEDRDYINLEYQALNSEIARVANNTQWNGENILDGTAGAQGINAPNSTVTFQVSANYSAGDAITGHAGISPGGYTNTDALAAELNDANGGGSTDWALSKIGTASVTANTTLVANQTYEFTSGSSTITFVMPNDASTVAIGEHLAPQAAVAAGTASDTISVDFGDMKTTLSSGASDVRSSAVSSQSTANSAIGLLDEGIKAVNTQRATFGAASNRLEHAVDNMTNIQNNAEASRSRIEDTDYAETTSELAKAQIIAQAGTAMLAQANQSSQSVLSLLR